MAYNNLGLFLAHALVLSGSGHHQTWLHAATQALRLSVALLPSTYKITLIISIQSWEEDRMWSITQEICGASPGSGSHHFLSYPIGWNTGTLPYPIVKEN